MHVAHTSVYYRLQEVYIFMFRYRKIDDKLTGWKNRMEESQT